MSQSGVGTPAARNSRFATSLSQPTALPEPAAAGVWDPGEVEQRLHRAVLAAAAVQR